MDFGLRDHTILMAVGGSRAYGIHTETSDVDIKGVAVPPRDYLLGCDKHFEQADKASHMEVFMDLFNGEELAAIEREKLEGVIYSLAKFMALAIDANPSIWDLLFCRDEEVRLATPLGEKLRDNRDLFISAKAKHTFSGYAFQQLGRIERHRRWLTSDMPEERPRREDFDLFEGIEPKQMDAALAAVRKVVDGWELDLSRLEKSERVPIMGGVEDFMAELSLTSDDKWQSAGRKIGYDENFLVILDKERRYRAAVEDWKKYQNWKKNRNPERAAMEAKYGFDLKHAAHLFRLLRMADEFMSTGKVNVWREDREEILAVRRGEWSYEKLVEWAKAKDAELTQRYKAKDYAVPHKPDREAINQLCVELTEAALRL